jgi:hypothetical protein
MIEVACLKIETASLNKVYSLFKDADCIFEDAELSHSNAGKTLLL